MSNTVDTNATRLRMSIPQFSSLIGSVVGGVIIVMLQLQSIKDNQSINRIALDLFIQKAETQMQAQKEMLFTLQNSREETLREWSVWRRSFEIQNAQQEFSIKALQDRILEARKE